MRAWFVLAPVMAGGVLVAHALAYRLTATPLGPSHDYLAHAPQVLLILVVVGLVVAGLGARFDAPPARAFPPAVLATFAIQEHLERLVHQGQLPFLLTTPVFLVGMALQVPVALVAWLLARHLLAVACPAPRLRPRALPRFVVRIAARPTIEPRTIDVRIPLGRAPPRPLST